MPTPVLAPQRLSARSPASRRLTLALSTNRPSKCPSTKARGALSEAPRERTRPECGGDVKATAPLSIQRVARFMPDRLDLSGMTIDTRRIDRPASLRLRPPGCRIRSVPGALFFVRPRNLVGAALEGRAVQATQDAAHPSRAPG